MARIKYREAAVLEVKRGHPPSALRQLILDMGKDLYGFYQLTKKGGKR